MNLAIVTMGALLAVAGESPAIVVQAPDSLVRLDRAQVLTSGDAPPVLLYSATNLTGDPIDEFTVMVFIFREGALKARQVAPGRRSLDAHGSKYSAMVLDGFPIQPADVIVVGVNQAQPLGSTQWWRAELQPAAEEAVTRLKK
jgi:hypothetical protein